MPLVEPGRKAPAFSLPDQHGRTHRRKDYADDTPGCTKEARAFRDARPDVKKGKAAARLTYLIGPDGTVARRWDRVKVDGHAAAVLCAVDEL